MSPACKLWSNSNGSLKHTSCANVILLSIAKAKAHWKVMLTHCLKNWIQKDKDEWFLDHLSWKRRAHSLMKQSISCLDVLCTFMTIEKKMVPIMKSFILVNLNSDTKFHKYTCWLNNDIQKHYLWCWINNHHINNKDLVFPNHVEISS